MNDKPICRTTSDRKYSDTKQCGNCDNDNPQYKCSDRHRSYYECQCGNKIVVDNYAASR